MTDEAPLSDYPSVQGLRIPTEGDDAIECRFIRGLEGLQPGAPDLVLEGDSLVSLHVDTSPPFADAIAAQLDGGDPVARFDGVTLPHPSGLVPVYALSRPRARLLAGEPVDLPLAAIMAEEELADWPQFRDQPYEVQITVDTSARPTRRTTIQFSWARANSQH